MPLIVGIIVFILFITYGISEHKLVVFRHNIRVFLSRVFGGIGGLFTKKDSHLEEWDNSTRVQKQRIEYRGFKEGKTNSQEHNLLLQIQKLEQEKLAQQQQYLELSTKHREELSSLSNQLKAAENSIGVLKHENEEYKQRLNGLLPIDRYGIANPFCDEYEQIVSITNRLMGRLIVEFESLSDCQKKQCYSFLADLIYDRQEEENNSVIRWYSLFKEVALVPKELSFDFVLKKEESLKLEFLQKYAFEQFYRKRIASVILFAENIRLSVSAQEKRKMVEEAISELIGSLQPYGISVDYVPVNTIISDTDFSKYEIESTINALEEENKVILVRKYAVNRHNVYAEAEKTVLVINI